MKRNSTIMILLICIFLKSHMIIKKENYEYPSSSSSMEKNEKIDVATKVIFPNESIYINDEAGYKITFPEYWQGNYVITEYGAEKVCIGFYGKSKTGQLAYKESLGRDGLDMAWVMSREQIPEEGCMVWGKIGEAASKAYFLTSPIGGAYLPELSAISDPESTSRKVCKYEVDETELCLVERDINTVQPMVDDLYKLNIELSNIEG